MGMVVRKFMELDFSIFTLTAKHTPYPWSRLNALAHNLPNRICLKKRGKAHLRIVP